MSWYLCFVLQNASMSMENWFVLCSIESKTSFIALCLVHLLCKWCWNCTKRHSLHIFENLVETERHLMHTSCIRLFTCLNVLLADRDIFKCLGSQTAWKAFYWRNSIFLYKLEQFESDIYKTLNQICSFCFSSATNAQNICWAHWPKVQKTINSNTLAKIVAESEIFASSILDKHQLLLPACCGMPTAHCIVNGQNWPQYFLDNPGGRWCTHHPHLLIQLLVWCWQAGPWCHTSSCGWRRITWQFWCILADLPSFQQ